MIAYKRTPHTHLRKKRLKKNLSIEARISRYISFAVGIFYYATAAIVFRQVLFAIPDIVTGNSVVVGDELVPFFNPSTQLFEQAEGKFSELTNGYEFRVRYSFLTTWLRHYQVLPFAILIVIPTIIFASYLITCWFMRKVFPNLSPASIHLGVAFPNLFIYAIISYAKITHFYTLMLGLSMLSISIFTMLYGVIFAKSKWYKYMMVSSLVTLFNPAVHYLVLFTVFYVLMAVVLLLGELARTIRRGSMSRQRFMHRVSLAIKSRRYRMRAARAFAHTTTGRIFVGGAIFFFITLIPYLLFVKYVALNGIGNLSETVPGDYYFIRDASVSWLHILSWDQAGIMDKVIFGDYLAKVPRYVDMVYGFIYLAPLIIFPMRRSLMRRRKHRQMFSVFTVTTVLAIWATVGYAEPSWFPTFHRSLAAVAQLTYSTHTPLGELVLTIASAIVQVLRFPHRFQLLLFALGPFMMGLTVAWALESLSSGYFTRYLRPTPAKPGHPSPLSRLRQSFRWSIESLTATSLGLRIIATICIGTIFFTPFLSNEPYRRVFTSGDFGTFLAPYPVEDLKKIKDVLNTLPEGKTIVLPPTETAKQTEDNNKIDHKFIDKFFIYYLGKPSYYYGLTGDAKNKFQFFLILRSLYYQQDWWINPMRDLGVKYIIMNRKLHTNNGIGAEYLPNVESYIEPALKRASKYITRVYENESFSLYQMREDLPDNRQKFLFDSSWKDYLTLVNNRLDLSACYKFDYLPYFEQDSPDNQNDNINNAYHNSLVFTKDTHETAINLWAIKNQAFFPPTPKTFPFDSNLAASSYYLSPMFRLFLLFSNTKWNRTGMIEAGLFGTLRGSFVGIPRPTTFSVPVKIPANGKYRLLLRGSATANLIDINSKGLQMKQQNISLRSAPGTVDVYDANRVYDADRKAIDVTHKSVEELEVKFKNDYVPVSVKSSYHDVGSVTATAGNATIEITKNDSNPMLFEGVVLVPENTYNNPELPPMMKTVSSPQELRCNNTSPVFNTNSEGYVDPAAHAEHRNLSNQELLDLAGADVPTIVPDDPGTVGNFWLSAAFLVALALWIIRTVRSHAHRRSKQEAAHQQPDSMNTTS